MRAIARRHRGHLLLFLALVLGLAACGGGGSNNSSSSGGQGSGEIDKTPVVVGWQSTPDEIYLPILMAIDAMKSEGYNISAKQFASTNITFQGLASNSIQLTADSLQAAAQGVQQGLPVKVVETRNANAVVYVANPAYSDCSKLSGKPVGIYSPQASYTVLMNLYFQQKCPGVKTTSVTIPDSPLRAQAMARGQIFATTLGLPDAMALEAQEPGKFQMVPLAGALPGIGDEYLIANEKTVKDHPTIVQAWVQEHLKAIRQLYQDPSGAGALQKKYFPSSKDDSIVKKLISDKLWYANGGLDGPGLENTLKGYSLPGDRASLVDDTALKAALKALGPSDATQY